MKWLDPQPFTIDFADAPLLPQVVDLTEQADGSYALERKAPVVPRIGRRVAFRVADGRWRTADR